MSKMVFAPYTRRLGFLLALAGWGLCRMIILPLGWYEITQQQFFPGFNDLARALGQWPEMTGTLRLFLLILFPCIYLFEALALHFFRDAFAGERMHRLHALAIPIGYFAFRSILFMLAALQPAGIAPLMIAGISLLAVLLVWSVHIVGLKGLAGSGSRIH